MQVSYIPLQAALLQVYEVMDSDITDYDTMVEQASYLMETLSVRQTYQEAISIQGVVNYKACLPLGTRQIFQIAYKEDLTESDVKQISVYTSSADSTTITTNELEFTKNNVYFRDWKIMRIGDSPWGRSIKCENSIDIYADSEYRYYVNKDKTLTLTMKTGYLAILYYSFPVNADGDFLIPDDEDYLKAMKAGILKLHWEKRYNYKEEGARERYLQYQKEWEIFAAKTRGKLLLMSIDEMENLKQQSTRLGQNYNSYYTGFGNRSFGEDSGLATHHQPVNNYYSTYYREV